MLNCISFHPSICFFFISPYTRYIFLLSLLTFHFLNPLLVYIPFFFPSFFLSFHSFFFHPPSVFSFHSFCRVYPFISFSVIPLYFRSSFFFSAIHSSHFPILSLLSNLVTSSQYTYFIYFHYLSPVPQPSVSLFSFPPLSLSLSYFYPSVYFSFIPLMFFFLSFFLFPFFHLNPLHPPFYPPLTFSFPFFSPYFLLFYFFYFYLSIFLSFLCPVCVHFLFSVSFIPLSLYLTSFYLSFLYPIFLHPSSPNCWCV